MVVSVFHCFISTAVKWLSALFLVSLRWTKLPPVWTNNRDHVREVPYMRYGHSAVVIDDTIYIWGGRNDTEGACNVLYAFDVSKCFLTALQSLLFSCFCIV